MYQKAHNVKSCEKAVKRACEANATGENSSFIFTICVISVPLDYFKLTYVGLHMDIKEFFETPF